ncbi:sodium/hydrogen exchanger 5 isoform X5 [Rhipicephalus sanguineus]|uniref:sodium/hydrogen exchanger 5 isoform X5 n=1 Tax=Rhipicephalus sanguineus TaxID=34632 RepID=UPI001892E91E|nr:sodium/hydrogen exchanger 5 isoform X5 [Rhipicephalus sanguineus]
MRLSPFAPSCLLLLLLAALAPSAHARWAPGSWREQRSGSVGLSSRSLHRRHTGGSAPGGGVQSPNDVPLPTLATAAPDVAVTTTTVAESGPRNASRPLANVDASSTANKSSHQGDRAGLPADRWSSSGRDDPLATAVGSSHRSPPSHGPDEVVGAPAHQTGVGDVDREAQCAAEREHEHTEGHHGVTVASIRWNFVSVPFVFTVFIILAGFTKIVFHHANFLSSIVPESCMLILLGTMVGGIAHVTHSDYVPNFSPDLFFLFLLPPIILESAYSLHDSAFFSNIGTILLFAVLGTIINAFTIGPSLYFLNNVGAIGLPNLNLLECLVFSSLISAVDPVAVLAIFQEVGVNKVLYFLVFGESLLNDAVTVVLYNMMVGFFGSDITAREIGVGFAAFLSVSLGASAIGCVMGMITAFATKYTHDVRVVEPLAVLGIAYLSYLTAELVHFSGIISIICCGLVQVQYAMGNISRKSYTTVKYFTKMLSAVSDTVIFIFLGIVLVNKRHVWNTGFVVWSAALCLVYRFLTVFGLTYFVNMLGRVKKINLEEQFIMAYGGLRGAVAFSLVIMLSACKFHNYEMFVTTTLVIVLFTVFIQGASVKPLVNLLKIRLQQTDGDKLIREINSKLVDNIMLGIEEITGHRGGNYWKQVMEQIDEKYLKPLLQHKSAQDSLTRVYTKVVLADHYAHLYGPAAALEENIPLNIQHCSDMGRSFDEGMLDTLTEERIEEEAVADEEEENAEDEDRGLLFHANTDRKPSIAPGQNQIADQVRAASQSAEGGTAEKRRHTVGAMFSRSFHQDSVEAEDPTKLLVKALNENPYHKYHQRYNPNLVGDEHQELEAHLRARRRRAHRLTLATMASEMSSAEMSVEGSRGNLAPPSPGATVLSPVTVGATTPVGGGGDVAATVAAAAALSAGVEQLADGRPLTAAQFRRASTTLQKSAYTWLSLAHRRHSVMRRNKAGSVDGRSLRSSLKLERQSAVTEDVSDDNAEHAKSESSSTQAHSREGSQSLQLSLAQQPPDVHEPGAEPASASEDSKSPEEKTKETSF